MNTSKKTLALRRLLYAIDCFREVASGCRALRQFASSDAVDFYNAFFAGICVTYMRPFRRADGLGLLPQEYSAFPLDSLHVQTHNDLKNGRDSAFAHYAPEQAAKLFSDPARQEVQKKMLILVKDGNFSYSSPAVTWAKERLSAIEDLALFQTERARAEAAKLLLHLAEGKKIADGTYTLDESFP